MNSELLDFLRKENIEFFEDVDMSVHSSFKVGGTAALSVLPSSTDALCKCIGALRRFDVRYEVIGNASNILFAFDRFDGAFVFTSNITGFEIEGTRVTASCGVKLTGLAARVADAGLSGLEFAYGIPALLGGAVHMNAGAYGSCVADVLINSRAYDAVNDCIVKLSAEEHKFDYRKSIFMSEPSLICLDAVLELKHGDKQEIKAKMKANMDARREKQPLEYPSAGSYFKRPEGYFAGKLIEDAGLKGVTVGGAQVSKKHAGFIINIGNATARDVLALEEKIKEEVLSRFGVELEREVRLIK